MAQFDPQAGRAMPGSPTAGSTQAEADDVDLRDGLGGLAATVSDTLGVVELLEQVSQFAVEAIPGVDGASVVVLRDTTATAQRTGVQAWGATSDVVKEIDRIQYELVAEGPCLTCIETHRPAVSGSLGSDARWPRFGGRVARLEMHSALSLPLMVRDRVLGAINSYARDRDVFTEHAVRLGERFAGPAAVTLHNARLLAAASEKAEQLQAALGSRAIIEQAIGIVRSRVGGSADEAFERLRRISQAENVKLSVVADRMVAEAVRRARARHSEP